MFNFNSLVSNMLLEQPVTAPSTPQTQTNASVQQSSGNDAQNIMKLNGFKNLINAYETQYGKPPDVNEILKAVNIVTGGSYIAAKYTNLGYTPFIDAFAQAYSLIDDKNKSNFTQTDIINFITQNAETFEPIFNKVAANLKNTTQVQDYEPSHPDVNRAWRSLTAETNKLSQVAIQSLGSDTVHSAITKIIAKRIPVLDRVMGLKGLVRPFNKSVITPILHQFKRYTGYKQGDFKKNPTGWLKDRAWPKKVSGDFSKMVEDISANNLLNIAVLAYEYYISQLGTQGKMPDNNQKQQINASFNLFDRFVCDLLNEEMPPWMQGPTAIQSQKTTPATVDKEQLLKNIAQNRKAIKSSKYKETPLQQTQQTAGLPPEQIEKISSQIGNTVVDDYESFLANGQSQYLPGIKYNLSTISKDPSREAQALYKALTEMAYFVRKGVGTKERLGYASQAAGAIAGFAGAGLYGGPQ